MVFQFIKCDFCNYTTDKKFNLKRHQNAKHKDINCGDHDDIAHAQKVPLKLQKVPPFLQKVPPNLEKVPPNLEKVSIDNNCDNITIDNDNIVSFNDNIEENIIIENNKKLFGCKKCGKQYNTKRHFIKHEEECKGIDILTCPKCMKSFSNKKHKSRHIKANKCKARSIIHAKTQNVQNIAYQNIENQNIYNNIQNIYINNFGSERTDYITYEDVKHMLMQGNGTVPLYIERKHFDKQFPENHNIKYTRDNKCKVFENNSWKEKDLSFLSSKLVQDNSRNLLLFCNDHEIRLVYDIQNDDIMDFVKNNLLEITHQTHKNYKEISSVVADLLKNTES